MLFFVLLLSVTASKYRSLDHLLSSKRLSSREVFNAFSQVGKEGTIQKLIGKLDDLLAQGALDLTAANDTHVDKLDAFNKLAVSLKAATVAHKTATTALDNSKTALEGASADVDAQSKKVQEAQAVKEDKASKLTQATKTRDLTVSKTTEEASDFDAIIELVKDLQPSQQGFGRRLFGTAEGDVDRILGFVKEMQDAALKEAAESEKALKFATQEHTDASDLFDEATIKLINLVETEKTAKATFNRDKLLLDDAISELNTLTDAHGKAEIELDNAKDFLENESHRVGSDAKVINDVKNLLQGLLI